MKIITYANSLEECQKLDKNNVDEIIVSSKEFSRFAKNEMSEVVKILNVKFKAKIIFEWDVLYPENKFKKIIEIFNQLPVSLIAHIRVQDPGILNFVIKNYPWMKIQLILETGNHNLIGLKRWETFVGDRLERIILSNELSKEHLHNYAKNLKTPIEVLIFGRILLFYSPRGLLKPVFDKKAEYIETFGTSEESPHSGFPLIENTHGTFMFNVKDLSLLSHVDEMAEMGIKYFRVDNRFEIDGLDINDILFAIKNSDFEIKGPRPFVKGFYNINKTDVLFVKLKNSRIQRNDTNYLGEVLDVEKDSQLCLISKKNYHIDEVVKLKLVTPEGKIKKIELKNFRNTNNENVVDLSAESLYLISYVNGVTVKTQIYLDDSNT